VFLADFQAILADFQAILADFQAILADFQAIYSYFKILVFAVLPKNTKKTCLFLWQFFFYKKYFAIKYMIKDVAKNQWPCFISIKRGFE
jgi:hypothetical protein